MAESFFEKLKLSSKEPLIEADKKGRIVCPKCQKKMKYFCYNCQRGLLQGIPEVILPIELDIIHHPTEKVSKSTAMTARIVSKDYSRWIKFPDEVPAYDPNDTLLLFPSPDAKKLSEVEDLKKYKRIVCIESVWYKADNVVRHPNVNKLQKVIIDSEETLFWRYQKISNANLSTIEAIYYFYKDYITAMKGQYNGECDDLLYFFSHIYGRIQNYYNERPDRRFVHIDGYIKYKDNDEKTQTSNDDKEKKD
ncbi:tRNA-uridine aminocarboxypropyltransferase 1 [Entamoeba marina]